MLTVVISNYNHARFLPISIGAILGQTRPADEIIIVDDASTDNSVAVIEPYLSRHPNIRLIRNERNRGVLANMNHGLAVGRGTYFFHAGADDMVYPTFFRESVRLLDQYPTACLFSCRCEIIDAEGGSQGILASPLPHLTPGYIPPFDVGPLLMKDDSWFNGATTVWRREALLEAGGYPADLGSFADGYISRLLSLKYGCCFSPAVLAAWRRMEGGMAWSASANLEKTTREAQDIARRMIDEGFPPDYPRRWASRHIYGARRFVLVQQRRQARSAGFFAFAAALAKEVWLSAWLFVTLRPRDILAMLKRRARAALMRL
jgi:glycosyltransferase involved in cell wall biosynthesis